MIRFSALVGLALTASACAYLPPGPPVRLACDVQIRFRTYGARTVPPLAKEIVNAVLSDRSLGASEWGPQDRKGDYDICVAARDPADARAIYDRYRAMLPERDERASITIEGPDGLRFQTSGAESRLRSAYR